MRWTLSSLFIANERQIILLPRLWAGSTSHWKYQTWLQFVCIFWVPCHNHLHTKNKIELRENNNINRIFVGHLYISLILQGSRMTETSNLLGCEMCLVDMWNVPFSMSLFYLVAIPEESEQRAAQQMAVTKYFGCQVTLTRREEENGTDPVSFNPCLGEN